ncbi:(2,3-dihydroxybenzoyl)adenylate synthase [Streptomyces sp. URMC 123]|uniref:(2,3-dihydroxybenzoyl)adenylate synthase n=2 Tax=unclassified Streptomyces TaxID=2593676 RepID=UPI003F1E2DE5
MREGWVPWPDPLAREYRARGYWTDETLGRWPAPADAATRTAVFTADRSLTYAELDRAADRLAAGLVARGLAAGDRVVVHLPNVLEFVVLNLALFRMGALPVLALPAHRSSEITHLVEASGAVAYVCQDELLGFDYRGLAAEVRERTDTLRHILVAGDPGPFTALAEVDADPVDLPDPDPGDVALFLLSGGTTGKPKLIPRTHADYAYQLRQTARLCGVGPGSTYLTALPAAHNFALACPGVLGTLRVGGTVALARTPSPEDCFPLIARAEATVTSLVPPLVPLWLETAKSTTHDLSGLKLLQVGGSRLAPETAQLVRPALDCTLQQVYGMAEGLLNYTRLDDPEEVVVHTQGRPLSPADEIRLVDEDGVEVAPGAVGELLTRGPYTLRGYYRAPEHNSTRFTSDGFFRTGDLVRVTPAGNLVVCGRVNDIVNRGGEKVPAEEVEEHLLADPRIRAAAVIGLPDRYMGEQTCACVVPENPDAPPTLAEVQSALRDRGVAPYKLPDRLEIVPALPLTGVGKVDKKSLARRFTAETANGGGR